MSNTPRCTDTTPGELLAAYEMGLLTPEEQAQFETHLSDCPACQEDLYEAAPMMTTLHADPGIVASRLAAEGAVRRTSPESLLDRLRALCGSRSYRLRWLPPRLSESICRIERIPPGRNWLDWNRSLMFSSKPGPRQPTKRSPGFVAG